MLQNWEEKRIILYLQRICGKIAPIHYKFGTVLSFQATRNKAEVFGNNARVIKNNAEVLSYKCRLSLSHHVLIARGL